MEDPFWVIFLIWGTWLVIAIIIDGLFTPFKLYFSKKARRKVKSKITDKELPYISLVVPAHNEEKYIINCLESIIKNKYPSGKLEIIVVDDGSTDDTLNIVKKYQFNARKYGKELIIIKKAHTGKVHTLNTGLRNCKGNIIICVDADVKLAPDSIKNIVIPFIEDKNVGAATGYIEVLWDKADKNNFIEMFFSKCEFLEYLSSFNFERSYQSFINSIYTMSGAFSAFRRDIIGKIGGYWPVTVSEDMHATMMLHDKKIQIVNVPEATAYVDAIIDYDTLYSQRVRWARGQLEVASMHKSTYEGSYKKATIKDILGIVKEQKNLELLLDYLKSKISNKINGLKQKTYKSFGLFGLARILFIDHTIGFPRLLWVFVLLLFPVFGLYTYLLPIVAIFMYLFYLIVDISIIIFVYYNSGSETRLKIEKSFIFVLLLPIYRLMTYSFRMSAFLHVLNEPADWKVKGPVNGFKNGFNNAKNGLNGEIVSIFFNIMNSFNFIEKRRKRGK